MKTSTRHADYSYSQRLTVAVIIFLLLQPLIFGQDSFVVIPPGEALRYKIDRRLFSNALSVIRNKVDLLEKAYQK